MLRMIVRFIVSALVLMAVGYVLPGFGPIGFLNALLAAVVISILGYLAESLLGDKASPQSRGVIGFISAAVVIYAAQFLVPALDVSILGALLASLVIGLIDIFVPTELR